MSEVEKVMTALMVMTVLALVVVIPLRLVFWLTWSRRRARQVGQPALQDQAPSEPVTIHVGPFRPSAEIVELAVWRRVNSSRRDLRRDEALK